MSKALWACCTCGEDFTRKFSAYRHRENVHSGKSAIVRFVEYLAGLASGLYPPPVTPPRLSGNKRPKFLKSGTDRQISTAKADKTIADSTYGNLWSQQRNVVNDNNFYRGNNPNNSSLQNNPTDEIFSTLDYAIEQNEKLLHFKTIVDQLSPNNYLQNLYLPNASTSNPITSTNSKPSTNPKPSTDLDYAIQLGEKLLRLSTIRNKLSPNNYLQSLYLPSMWTLNPIFNPASTTTTANPASTTTTSTTNPASTTTSTTNPASTTTTNPASTTTTANPASTTNSKVLGVHGEVCTKCCSGKIEGILSFDILEPLVKTDHICESEDYLSIQNKPNNSAARKDFYESFIKELAIYMGLWLRDRPANLVAEEILPPYTPPLVALMYKNYGRVFFQGQRLDITKITPHHKDAKLLSKDAYINLGKVTQSHWANRAIRSNGQKITLSTEELAYFMGLTNSTFGAFQVELEDGSRHYSFISMK
jgi:hypothetical protein